MAGVQVVLIASTEVARLLVPGDADCDSISDSDEFSASAVDSDGDGSPDYIDRDSDNDGIPDSTEAGDLDINTPPVSFDDGDSSWRIIATAILTVIIFPMV